MMIVLGLVGRGKWGSNYLRAVKDIPACRIAYIATRNYQTLVEHKDIDGIIIATPANSHYEISRFFLQQNIPLLIEKPLTTSYRDALKLQKLYKKRKSIVMVGHIYLHNPAFKEFRDAIPEIGELRYVLFESGNYGPFRNDVTALWDWGAHDVSMCLTIMQKDPIAVTAWGGDDIVMMRLDFARGTSAFITTARIFPERKRYCAAIGCKGSIVFDELAEEKVIRYTYIGAHRHVYHPYDQEEPLVCQLRHFTDAIKNHTRQDNDFLMGVRVVGILDAAQQSLKNHGKTIQIIA